MSATGWPLLGWQGGAHSMDADLSTYAAVRCTSRRNPRACCCSCSPAAAEGVPATDEHTDRLVDGGQFSGAGEARLGDRWGQVSVENDGALGKVGWRAHNV